MAGAGETGSECVVILVRTRHYACQRLEATAAEMIGGGANWHSFETLPWHPRGVRHGHAEPGSVCEQRQRPQGEPSAALSL